VRNDSDLDMKSDDSLQAKDTSTKGSDTESPSKPDATKEEITNDGIKILEEVFGKASVDDTRKEEAKASETDAAATLSFGPVPPTEEEYDQDELNKAEEFKNQGNEFFKRKSLLFF